MDRSVSLEAQLFVLALAKEGSFARAARTLNITQPALTRKVTEIEKQLGVKLFKRGWHHLELTAAGQVFVPEAQASVLHAERAFELARQKSRMESGPLRIGYSSYIHSDLVPILHRWQVEGTSSMRKVVLESGTTNKVMEGVISGQLHAGLGLLPIADDELWVTPVGREQLSVCLPKNHRLASKANLSVKDLHGEIVYWFSRAVHPKFYDQTIEYIRSQGVQPIFHEAGAGSQAMEIVAHGFGLTLLPRSFNRYSRTGIVFKLLTDLFLRIETGLFVRNDQRQELLEDEMRLMFFELRAFQARVQ